jgi:molybdenum cofactor cytidylyltransferase
LEAVYKINQCAIIILAAGASSRLGTPKQLLRYKGKSLLQNIVSTALGTRLRPVIVVVGANAPEIISELTGENVHIINNHEWPEGIASSIRCGVRSLEKTDPVSDGTIIMVCDQPHITAGLLNNLLNVQKETGKAIAASTYNDIEGTPALFHKSKFPELLLLKGDKGAGKMLQQQIFPVVTVPFPEGAIDIDTKEDYENLRLAD